MPVYLPTAIVGNSRILATLGASGELMALFYPRLDWAQNIHEALNYIVIDSGGLRTASWTFEGDWQRSQQYHPDSTVVQTVLRHQKTAVRLVIDDWIPAKTSYMIRKFGVSNEGPQDCTVSLFQYMNLSLGEVAFRNAVRYIHEESAIVQQWHEFCFVVGGDPFDEWQCGKADESAYSNAKNDLYDGKLNRQPLDIGDVNFSVGWSFRLRPGEGSTRHLAIAPDKNEAAALGQLRRIRKEGFDRFWARGTLRRQSPGKRGDFNLARQGERSSLPADLHEACERSLRILPLLFDEKSGACLAAPEFDPCFVQSGGYGYCWPRDAAVAVLALAHAGRHEFAEPFFRWCQKSQAEEGYWHQRYWLSGDVGPSWCTPDSAIQIDQTGSVVHAMSVYYRELPDFERPQFLKAFWDTVRSGAEYLAGSLTDTGLHETAYDLWETFRGSFLYSNASIFAALTGAAQIAQDLNESEAASRWEAKAQRLKDACLSRLWNGSYLMRGLTESGAPDMTVDSSVLGALVPFGLIDLSNPAQMTMLKSTIEVVERSLEVEVHGLTESQVGRGIRRYENDSYAGGPAAAVNTLWMALVQLKMAEHESASDLTRLRIEKAMGYMRTCLSRATPTGLLPELMGGPEGAPWWAAPHAWCTGWFIECCLGLKGRLTQ